MSDVDEMMSNIKSRLRSFVLAMPLARHQEMEDIINDELEKIHNKLVELSWKAGVRNAPIKEVDDLLIKERTKSGYTESSKWVGQTFFKEEVPKRRGQLRLRLSQVWGNQMPMRRTNILKKDFDPESIQNWSLRTKEKPYKISITDLVSVSVSPRRHAVMRGFNSSYFEFPIKEDKSTEETMNTIHSKSSSKKNDRESFARQKSKIFQTTYSFMYNPDGTRIKYQKIHLKGLEWPPILQDESFGFKHGWEFDVVEFAFRPEVANMPLLVLGHYLIIQTGLNVHLNLDMNRVDNWLRSIEKAYRDNPFHNHLHGADVMCTMYYWFNSPIFKENMTPLDLLASLAASCAHDVGHDGVNNLFHVKMWTAAATRWNDASPLENLHASLAFKLLYKYENNWLHTLMIGDQFYMRKLMVKLILATDNYQHRKHQESILTLASCIEQHDSKSSGMFILREGKDRGDINGKSLPSRVQGEVCEKSVMLKAAIHIADISNAAKPNRSAVYWAESVTDEFFNQGDRERFMGLDISPLCDRFKSDMEQGQAGFIKFVVMPAYQIWVKLVPEAEVGIGHLKRNLAFWNSKDNRGLLRAASNNNSISSSRRSTENEIES